MPSMDQLYQQAFQKTAVEPAMLSLSTHVVVTEIKKTEHFKKEGVINNVKAAGA